MSEHQTSFGRQTTRLAEADPQRIAIVHVDTAGRERSVTRLELDRRSNQCARLLAAHGVGQGSVVVIALRNCPEHYVAVIGAWKLGATVLPLRWDLPAWERERLLTLAKPAVVVGAWEAAASYAMLALDDIAASSELDDSVLPDRIPNPARMMASSGSSGSPKLIVSPAPGVMSDKSLTVVASRFMGLAEGCIQLVTSPMYHMNGIISHTGLQHGRTLVVMERFDAARAVDLIVAHRVNYVILVPIMLQRFLEVPGLHSRDLSSLQSVHYGAATLAPRIAHAWLKLVGPRHFFFSYGSTEGLGFAMASGVEWLTHEGTVGKPLDSVMGIFDEHGHQLPAGEIGTIYVKRFDPAPTFSYVGAEMPQPNAGGYLTLGDMGYLDGDGYLYVVDRRSDLIISGGANIYPAEVETALSSHPEVADVVVVGLPDEEWGRRLHAIIQPRRIDDAPGAGALRQHCRALLAPYKVPKSFEFVHTIPRSEAGKVSRGALTAERATAFLSSSHA